MLQRLYIAQRITDLYNTVLHVPSRVRTDV
jgi:hypothetical protein